MPMIQYYTSDGEFIEGTVDCEIETGLAIHEDTEISTEMLFELVAEHVCKATNDSVEIEDVYGEISSYMFSNN